MQEEYRTDFCLKGSVIEINFHQYRQVIGLSNRRKNRDDSEEAYKCAERIHRQRRESG